MDRFIGKVVVITGAGGPGTGGAAARRFAAEGAKVVASDIDESGLDDLRGSAKPDHGGEIVTRRADVVDAADVQALVDFAVATFGQLDVMVNHAVSMPRPSGGDTPFARPLVPDIPPQDWRAGIDGVLNSVFYGCHAAIPHLARTRGAIVNTASISGMGGDYGMAAYDTAKAGVINLTRALAVDHGDDGIRVNCVSPGAIAYPSGNMFATVEEPYLARVPLRRFAAPEDIAAAMAFLASDDASYITGHNLVVDGGITSASGAFRLNCLAAEARVAGGFGAGGRDPPARRRVSHSGRSRPLRAQSPWTKRAKRVRNCGFRALSGLRRSRPVTGSRCGRFPHRTVPA